MGDLVSVCVARMIHRMIPPSIARRRRYWDDAMSVICSRSCVGRATALRFVAVCALLLAASARADFEFVALGDTAYNGEKDYPPYEALIDLINETAPAFSIHVGDIWGAGTCED